jgi:hypothetical protein
MKFKTSIKEKSTVKDFSPTLAELSSMADPSFLPYLTGSKTMFSIQFSSGQDDLNPGTAPRFPFDLISDASALTRIIGARIISDTGSLIKPVSLLISRDDYSLTVNVLTALTNLDIESIWQKTFLNHHARGSLITLSAQTDESGSLIPFRSLFSCTKTGEFFHPPCPQCGFELELCRDDKVLEEAGLKPYSKSLARYLACPSCALKDNEKTFYSFAPDAADPGSVKSPADLINGFGGLMKGDLPCTRCPEHTSCYKDRHVLSLIIPIAFYPFYLIMFEAPSLNAQDFLSLISGEPFDELEQGLAQKRQFARKGYVSLLKERTVTPVLFVGDERQFLEILYLKLSILGEIAQYILSGERKFAYPEFGPSLDRLWVQIPFQSDLLPTFWNFRLMMMGMDPDIPVVLPSPGADYAAHCMGMLWFHALLKNRELDIRAINTGIVRVLKKKQADINGIMFKPDNIFWAPRPAPKRWRPLWEKALGLGTALLVEAGKTGSLPDGFWAAYHALRDEIRKELFSEAPLAQALPEVAGEDKADDAQIGHILARIRSKWAQEGQAQERDVTKEAVYVLESLPSLDAHEDAQATMIITPERPSARDESGEEYSKTSVLPAQPQQQAPAVAEEEDFSTETIIMQHQPGPAAKGPEAMDQTVVVSPKTAKTGPKEKIAASEKPAEKDLEETLIMGAPAQGAPAPAQKKSAQTDEDELAQTVILKPEKKK